GSSSASRISLYLASRAASRSASSVELIGAASGSEASVGGRHSGRVTNATTAARTARKIRNSTAPPPSRSSRLAHGQAPGTAAGGGVGRGPRSQPQERRHRPQRDQRPADHDQAPDPPPHH